LPDLARPGRASSTIPPVHSDDAHAFFIFRKSRRAGDAPRFVSQGSVTVMKSRGQKAIEADQLDADARGASAVRIGRIRALSSSANCTVRHDSSYVAGGRRCRAFCCTSCR